MTRKEFIALLQSIYEEEEIQVAEQLEMTDGFKPLLDRDGNQIINDVVLIGDGRLYIDRDGNEPDAEQKIIDLLKALYDTIPDLIRGLEHLEYKDQCQ